MITRQSEPAKWSKALNAHIATREAAAAASQNETTWINSIRFNGTRPIDNVRIKSLHIQVKPNQISNTNSLEEKNYGQSILLRDKEERLQDKWGQFESFCKLRISVEVSN